MALYNYYLPFFQLGSQDQSLAAPATNANQTTSSNSSTTTPSSPPNSTGALQSTTPTQNPSSTANPESTGAQTAPSGLTDGEKIGLGVGATLFVVLLASALGCLVRRVRKQTQLGVDDDDDDDRVQDPPGSPRHDAPQASRSRLTSLLEVSPATPSVQTESLAELSAEPRCEARE
ncbi:hypothetical protein RB594_008598 [Gaeumannomyces avenae]